MKKKVAYFTICARNYLAYALTLRSSLLAASPDSSFYIFVADAPIEDNMKPSGNFIALEEINLPDPCSFKFRYTVLELATAIKPFCFLHLMEQLDFDAAVYLDPDIEVFSPLTEVEEKLRAGVSCVLTPHLLKPLSDDFLPSDLEILASGTFNLGFAAFSKNTEAIEFINWWARHLETNCLVELERGLFVDQKFVDFAPSFIEKIHILRHPGYNVAYWNLKNRSVERDEVNVKVDSERLVFFHFSGVVPGDATILSKHQNRFEAADNSAVQSLVIEYLDRLENFENSRWQSVPYAFDQFETGEPILKEFRRGQPAHASNPLQAPNLKFWSEPSNRVDQIENQVFTRYMLAKHQSRQDLREHFSLASAPGRHAFFAWINTNAEETSKSYPTLLGSAKGKSKNGKWKTRAWLALGRALKLI